MNLFRSVKQYYMDMKLKNKLTLVLILIVFLPALLTLGFFYDKFYGMVVSDTLRKEQAAVATVVPQLNDILESIEDVSAELTELSFYRDLFFAPVNDPIGELLDSEEGQKFALEVENLLSPSPVDHIRIYLDIPEEDLMTGSDSSGAGAIFGSVQKRNSYWRGIFEGTDARSLYCPPFYMGEKEKNTYGDEAYIRSTTIYYQGSPVKAYIACYYSSSLFTQILQDNLSLRNSVSYIVNDRNSIVAYSDISLTGLYQMSYESIESSFMSSDSFILRTILGENVYAAYNIIGKPQWFLVTVLPQKPMIHQSVLYMLRILFLYLALLILAFIIASLLSRSITGRISAVIDSMNSVREGPPMPLPKPDAHDEIGDLINTYNYMTERMNLLLEKQAQDAEDLRIAEFNSLQAQINPHFLYNTMDMINWMAAQGRTEEISSAVQKLSRFYRLTLSRKNAITTVAEEIEHISIYIELQNMRYHDSITFILDLPDEINDCPIPRLTLQPVIENAILHGILEKESKSGTIVLTGWMEEKSIVLLISDDGAGIPPQVLKTILSGNGKSSSGGTNIGVFNTHRRLQLLYGKDYGLHYHSESGQGTEVEIKIPSK